LAICGKFTHALLPHQIFFFIFLDTKPVLFHIAYEASKKLFKITYKYESVHIIEEVNTKFLLLEVLTCSDSSSPPKSNLNRGSFSSGLNQKLIVVLVFKNMRCVPT
jgi:hypothetical protein